MKLITLNTWGGKVTKPLTKFITEHIDIDIFCFQEVFHDAKKKTRGDFIGAHLELYTHLQSLLPNHSSFFSSTVDDYYGNASFVKKDFDVHSSGDIRIFENPAYSGKGGNHMRKMLWLEISGGKLGKNMIAILNVHGLWNGKGKSDTPDRIEQSKRIKEFMDSMKIPKILCGDLNLLPHTESLKMLEKNMQNMIKEYKVTSTRTSLYTRAETNGEFADYIFLSPNFKVHDFKVLPDEVSDHSPLYLEFNLP
ncbi:MAG: endonuclease/exonuclease/phosphatase family protein [Candidatus Taylorbacteria bacterium]|nr:endonuclease/exonuclease/phosphatase family protein [Candidatus Taylorbacteria bacterium]